MVSSLCPTGADALTTSPLAGRAAPTPAQQCQPRDINACCERVVAVLLFGDTVRVLSRVRCSPAPTVPLSTTTAVTPAPCAHHNAIGAAETKQPSSPAAVLAVSSTGTTHLGRMQGLLVQPKRMVRGKQPNGTAPPGRGHHAPMARVTAR